MTTKPGRDTVEEMLNDFEAHELIGSRRDVYELVVSVFKDWLAQGEELQMKNREIGHMTGTITYYGALLHDGNEMCAKLQTENKALKASMEAEYIERQAKHIQALVEENQALKDNIALLELEDESDKWNELHLEEKYGDDEP